MTVGEIYGAIDRGADIAGRLESALRMLIFDSSHFGAVDALHLFESITRELARD